MLTLKPKVLKNAKKDCFHELKHAINHCYESICRQGERRTENH